MNSPASWRMRTLPTTCIYLCALASLSRDNTFLIPHCVSSRPCFFSLSLSTFLRFTKVVACSCETLVHHVCHCIIFHAVNKPQFIHFPVSEYLWIFQWTPVLCFVLPSVLIGVSMMWFCVSWWTCFPGSGTAEWQQRFTYWLYQFSFPRLTLILSSTWFLTVS